MGMFDRVWVQCPNCSCQVEFQSKAGECNLHEYTYSAVPAAIADDLDGEEMDCWCGMRIRLGQLGSDVVPMYITIREVND